MPVTPTLHVNNDARLELFHAKPPKAIRPGPSPDRRNKGWNGVELGSFSVSCRTKMLVGKSAMLNKVLVLLLAAVLLAGGPVTEVSVLSWSTVALAGDDDDDDDDDRRRPRLRLQLPRAFPRAPRAVTRREQSEIIATGLSAADLDRLLTEGFTLLRRQQITLLGTELARLRAPSRLSRGQALERARRLVPNASFANNDLYRRLLQAPYRPSGGSCGQHCEAFEITAWTLAVGRCATGVAIGVVDTGVDLSHPSLAGARVTLRTIRSPDRPPSDVDHGTAVVSLLVGNTESDIVGIIPGARVLAADAFHGRGHASSADAHDLIVAIDWLVSEGVKVVNLSLSGPHNEHLQRIIARAQSQGVHLIAASGQPDRNQMSGYPAKYPGVIAVSAVDNRLRPSRLAIRGDHISFAAPGAGIAVARRPSGVRRVEGTSFAAPFVSAAYAVGLERSKGAAGVTDLLARSARDLGVPGRDSIYGWGLLQFSALPRC
jgi:minor extracellular protease Epr